MSLGEEISEMFIREILYGPSEETIAYGQAKASMNGYLGWHEYDKYRTGGKYSKENHPVDKKLLYKAYLAEHYTPEEAARLSGYDRREDAAEWLARMFKDFLEGRKIRRLNNFRWDVGFEIKRPKRSKKAR